MPRRRSEAPYEISSRTTSPKRRRRSSERNRLEQVVSLVRDFEIGVARDSENRVLEDLDIREEPIEEASDQRFDRSAEPALCRPAGSAAASRVA